MKIILKEDITNLGYKDDVVEVKNGYARNFLIPQGKAIIASESALKILAENLRQRAHKLAKIKADAEAVAAKFEGVSVNLTAKVGKDDNIYGSINSMMIAEALQAQGIEIDRKAIEIKEAIKTLGEHTVTVKLHKEVSVELPVVVTAE